MGIATGNVYTARELKALEVRLFHVSYQPIEIGTQLRSSDFQLRPHYSFFVEDPPQHFLEQDDYRARRLTEEAFEMMRPRVQLDLPSRKKSLFTNLTIEDANYWAQKRSRKGGIYELSVADSSRALAVDFVWYNYCVREIKGLLTHDPLLQSVDEEKVKDIDSAAYKYWKGILSSTADGTPRIEVLLDGVARIVSRVD